MHKTTLPSSIGSLGVLAALSVLLSGCTAAANGWTAPMDDLSDRPLLLTFGLYVTPDPAQNPIDPPERFTGFHSALDVEVYEDEADKDVPVYAACAGEVLQATTAEGYGGLILQRCLLNGEDVIVTYGHTDASSFTVKAGDTAEMGTQIAVLAPAHSAASDGNRKHLHFGIHRGREIVTLGYVQTEAELADFVDPSVVLGL